MKLLIRIRLLLTGLYARRIRVKGVRLFHHIGALHDIAEHIQKSGVTHPLILTDSSLTELGYPEQIKSDCDRLGMYCSVFDGVVPNPTTDNVEAAKNIYRRDRCDAVIACGGGSVIDCAKMTAVVVESNKPVQRYNTLIPRIRKRAPLFVLPTTAGSGSEVTISAVITDSSRDVKMPISDPQLTPDAAFLDGAVMTGLPQSITAGGGMDALTHAVESYIGTWNMPEAADYAKKTVRGVFENMSRVYEHGDDTDARSNMALAACYGGYAFRTAGLGYTHAIAHRMSELYGMPHGIANAIILPHVLEYSFEHCYRKLAELARYAALCDAQSTESVCAQLFIDRIRDLNQRMNISDKIEMLREGDIQLIAKRALKEAHSIYPVPVLMNTREMRQFLMRLMPDK